MKIKVNFDFSGVELNSKFHEVIHYSDDNQSYDENESFEGDENYDDEQENQSDTMEIDDIPENKDDIIREKSTIIKLPNLFMDQNSDNPKIKSDENQKKPNKEKNEKETKISSAIIETEKDINLTSKII